MPELPELEIVRDVLQRRVVGTMIDAVQVLPPGGAIVIRDMTHQGMSGSLNGRTIAAIKRRGKFLIFTLSKPNSQSLFLVVNPKLTGRLQLAQANERSGDISRQCCRAGAAGTLAVPLDQQDFGPAGK